MVTLPFSGASKQHKGSRSSGSNRHPHPPQGRSSKASISSSSFYDPSSTSTSMSSSLLVPHARRELFGGGGGGGGSNKTKATSRRHRGMIRLKDSIEEEADECEEVVLERTDEDAAAPSWGGAPDWPSSSYKDSVAEERAAPATTATTTTTTADPDRGAADTVKASSTSANGGGGGRARGLLRLASTRMAGGNHASFQRLDDVTSSASDPGSSSGAGSASFDVNHNPILISNINNNHVGGRGLSEPAANPAGTDPTAEKDFVGMDGTTATSKPITTLGNKLKIKIKGTKTTFQKLENVEGSHGNCGYVPPSDYASFVGGTRDDALANPTLRLLQLASQSHYAQPSPHEDKSNDDERRTEKSSSVSKRDEDDHNEPREEVEFRQFVFDKNFSAIEAVNVEKSDSGTVNDDIFRMAAVETVTRMSLANFGSPSHKSNVPSPTNPQQKLSFKSPSRRSGGPKPYSPASGALPKSPTRRARALSAIPKVAPPGGTRLAAAPSGAASPAGAESSRRGSKAPSEASSVDDVSKKRFQDLVKRTGKLSVQSPLPSSPFTQDSPGRSGGAFGSSSRQVGVFASPSPSPQQTSKTSNSYASTREGTKTRGTKDIPFNSRSRAGSGAAPVESLSTNPAEASPLGTRRHFGNSGGRRFAPKSSPLSSLQGSKTRTAPVKTTFPSGVSAASVANATVSTGPDENQRVIVGEPAERQDPFRLPSTSDFEYGDNDDPFRIGQDDPWKDSAAWDVARVAFPAPRRQEATPKTTTGSTSSASRGDNSLLIQSIRSAIHQKSRAARHREAQVPRPDPSPRGVPHSSSDSFLDFVPAKQGGRSGKGQVGEHDDIVTSKSDGAMDADHRTLGSVPSVSASPVTMARISQGRKPSSKAPSGVPEHAILASMLFRQTEVYQQNDKMEAKDSLSHGPSSSKLRNVHQKPVHHNKYGPSTDAGPAHPRFDVPAAVHTSSAASIVSSVTEEASVFYSKNLQASSYKSQAQTALNNYHNLRSKQVLQHQLKHQAPSVNTGSTQTQRGLHPNQHQQQQQQQHPPRKWESSSSSRKTTASSTGRPTWLDRVEEEHKRMFS